MFSTRTMIPVVLGLLAPAVGGAQDKLALLIPNSMGPNSGLVVDSEALLPDGSTHSAHFFSASAVSLATLSSLNAAMGMRLASLPLPSPAAGFTYSFSPTSGVFTRSTQSLGPILGDRADTLGKDKLAIGVAYQRFTFNTIDGISLGDIPLLFRHDGYQLGGGRSDVITSATSIDLRSEQLTSLFNYGLTDRWDLAVAVPVIRVDLAVRHALTLYRIGSAARPQVHFFRDPDPNSPNPYGDRKTLADSGSTSGLGDITFRTKARLKSRGTTSLAAGAEVRIPTGDEMDLLGSGALGVKPFAAVSFTKGPVTSYIDMAYQWNGDSVLAGSPVTGEKAKLPDEFSYTLGGDIHVKPWASIEVGLLGRQLTTQRFSVEQAPDIAAGVSFPPSGAGFPPTFANTQVDRGPLSTLDGSVGLKFNPSDTLLIDLNVLCKIGGGGLRANVTPLLGIEFTF